MATIQALPSGKFRIRVMDRGRQTSMGTYPSRDAAERAIASYISKATAPSRHTLEALATPWIASLRGSPSFGTYASRWRAIAKGPLWTMDASSIRAKHIEEWLESTPYGYTHRRSLKGSLSALFQRAKRDGRIRTDPTLDVELVKPRHTRDPWTWLRLHELTKVMELATQDERDVIGIAVGTGMRAGELTSLEWSDVHATYITVRYGGPKHAPTKSGKPRDVPLFGLGRTSMESWESRHPRDMGRVIHQAKNRPLGRGVNYGMRHQELYHDAGLYDVEPDRPLTWHSLRHTCASLLVSGAWGRQWSLREVQELLGHARASTTERYAHLCGTLASRAAEDHDRLLRGG